VAYLLKARTVEPEKQPLLALLLEKVLSFEMWCHVIWQIGVDTAEESIYQTIRHDIPDVSYLHKYFVKTI
jgi:hypothetical protein